MTLVREMRPVDTGEGLGAFVRSMRMERRMTQEDLAYAIGREQEYISRLERGLVKEPFPPPEEAQALARALGVTIGQMLDAAGYRDDADVPDDERIFLSTVEGLSRSNLPPYIRRIAIETMEHAKRLWEIEQERAEEAARRLHRDRPDTE